MKTIGKLASVLLITVMIAGLMASADGTAVYAATNQAKPGKPVVTVSETDRYGEVLITIGKTENADGYRIYCKSDKDFKYKKLANVEGKGTKKRTYTAKNLESGLYSFRVRAYSKSSGKTVWGSYSGVVKINVVDASTRARIDRMNEIAADEYPELYNMVEEGKLGLTMDDTSNIYFTLGSYDMIDGNLNREKKDIEWICLEYDEDNGKALFFSHYILDKHFYNDVYEDVTWETCTLRTWLNETFLYSSFSEKEIKELILQSQVVNSRNNTEMINGGNDTKDRVFLLSAEEFELYKDELGSNASGRYHNSSSSVKYALRSPGGDLRHISYIDSGAVKTGTYKQGKRGSYRYKTYYGEVFDYAGDEYTVNAIRPAIWINMN